MCHCFVAYKPALPKEIESNNKPAKLSVSDRVRNAKYKHIFSKVYTENYLK